MLLYSLADKEKVDYLFRTSMAAFIGLFMDLIMRIATG